MEQNRGPIEFLRKKIISGSSVKLEFITFKKINEDRNKFSTPAYYEFFDKFLNIFFFENQNFNFKRHKENLKKEKEPILSVTILNWKADVEMKISYSCKIISIKKKKFTIELIEAMPKNFT